MCFAQYQQDRMSDFKDYFSDAADAYRKFRPRYPEAMIEFLADSAPSRSLAWDCATGNGQAAGLLARYFDRVIASDASRQQVSNTAPADGVDYRVERAEASSLETHSADLVTVAQALHWFDLPAFEQEVRRVGKPGAVLAAWSYELLQSTPPVDAVIERLYDSILGEYWTEERRMVQQGYRDIAFSLESLDAPTFSMQDDWSLDRLLGYLSTWSARRRYQARHGRDPLTLVADDLAKAWGDPASSIRVSWPLTLKVWRLPA